MIFKILPSDKIRLHLCIEDVDVHNLEVLTQFGVVSKNLFKEEWFYIFHMGYPLPYFNVFFASKIKSISDPYLLTLVERLYFLNPGNTPENLKRITSFILMNFTVTKPVESEVTNTIIQIPVITFEELFPVIQLLVKSTQVLTYVPNTEKVVMYSKNCTFSKGDKISINAKARAGVIEKYYSSAIHHAAEFLNENEMYLKITDVRIQETDLVVKNNVPVSVKTINRYMSQRTKELIKEMNSVKPFKTKVSFEKYCKFTELPADMSADEIASVLNVSKSTVQEFRAIYDQLENYNKNLIY